MYSALLLSVSGLQLSAGKMGISRPGIGDEPTAGLRGAEGGVKHNALRGPVEHQASLTSDMAIALDLKLVIEYRMVGRIYFRLRLTAAPPLRLQFARKRYHAPRRIADEAERMQKRATPSGWRIVAKALALSAVTLLLSVSGLQLSAGKMGISRPGIGDEPTAGLRGAEGGVKHNALRGPVEHQVTSEVGRGKPMSPSKRYVELGKLFEIASEQNSLHRAWQRIRANGLMSSASETRVAVEMFDRDAQRNIWRFSAACGRAHLNLNRRRVFSRKKAAEGNAVLLWLLSIIVLWSVLG